MIEIEKKAEKKKITFTDWAAPLMLVFSGISMLLGNMDGAIYTVLLLISALLIDIKYSR